MESAPAGSVTPPRVRISRVFGVALSLLSLAVALQGCSRVSRDDPIRAHDDASFDEWVAVRQPGLTLNDTKELNEARQQIKYRVMQQHPGMMSDDFTAAVYQEIDGRTVHDLLLTSYALQIERLRTELANFRPLVERYEGYRANPRLTEPQRKDVEYNLDKLARLIRERNEELERVTQRLNELKQSSPAQAH